MIPATPPDSLRLSGAGPSAAQAPERTRSSAARISRPCISHMAMARSATSSFSTSGVFVTLIPRAVASPTLIAS